MLATGVGWRYLSSCLALILSRHSVCLVNKALLSAMPLLVLVSVSMPTQAVINLSDDIELLSIKPYLHVYEDTSRTIQFSEVIEKDFRPVIDTEFNPGFTASVYWVRFSLANKSSQNDWVIRADYPPMDSIVLYSPLSGGYQAQEAGDLAPFLNRPIKNNKFLFPISPGPEEQFYYARFETKGSMHIDLELLSQSALVESVGQLNYFQGAYIGIIFVMGLYNLFLYIYVREKSYLSYACFIITMGLFQMSIHGYAIQFIWPEAFRWNNISYILFSGLAMCFLCKFSQHFVQTDKFTPTLHQLVSILAYFALANSLLVLVLPYQISITWISILNIMTAATVLLAVAISFFKGSQQAKYFLMSFFVLIFAGMLYTMSVIGWLPDNSLFQYAFQIGGVISVVLLSVGLADKINGLSEKALAAEKDANRIKDEFMSTVTHELLTPVNGIRLSLDLLKPKLTLDDQRELHRTAADSSVHLLNLIESMFTFVETRRGSLKITPKAVRLKSLFDYIFNCFRANESAELEMVMELDSNLPEIAVVDEGKLTLVLSQLLKNACAFTKEGKVTLKVTSLADDMCRIEVKDTGAGIENKMLKKIFNAFHQGDNSLVRKHSGLGIGLSIVKDILDLFGAELVVESEVGKGTTASFIFKLGAPSQTEIDSLKTTGEKALAEMPEATLNILVVEDNAVNSILICKVLKSAGYNPITAVHGLDALAVLDSRQDIHAVLMDCQMPVMHGYEATERIRQHPVYRNIPIIAVTANVAAEDRERCYNSGMDDFLAKPVKKEILLDKLRHWLEHGRKEVGSAEAGRLMKSS